MPAINRTWLDVLTLSSNSPQGLVLTDESALLPAAVHSPVGHELAHSRIGVRKPA